MYKFLGIGLTYDDLNEYQKNKANWLENVDRYSDATKKAYWVNLNTKVADEEVSKNKDLYDWNKDEIIKLIKDMPTKSYATKTQVYTAIVRYMEWTYKEGNKEGENPCDSINTKELFAINEIVLHESYIELQKFYDFILELNCSDVDRAMLTLLRYGVKVDDVGKVKWEDVDRENKILKIIRNDKEIELPIDNLFIMIINQAKSCDRYAPGQKLVEYVDYGYVIKATPTVKWREIPAENVYNKVGMISRNNKIQRISVPDLNDSRKYDLLFNILKDYGKVTRNNVERIIEIFGEESTIPKILRVIKSFELISEIEVDVKRKIKQNKNILTVQ